MRGVDRGVVLGLYRSAARRDQLRALLTHALILGVEGIDTAYNYAGYASHRLLGAAAGSLLEQFTVSTKVGFFPADPARLAAGSVHSLDPARLGEAAERAAADLGRIPDILWLHSPERSLADIELGRGRDRLIAACAAMSGAQVAGCCRNWGLAVWDPVPLLPLLDPDSSSGPSSGVESAREVSGDLAVMVRAGLTVTAAGLASSEILFERLNIPRERRWGMSPFGGRPSDPVWAHVDLAAFLTHDQHQHHHRYVRERREQRRPEHPEAAFRLAFELPTVARVAVGTDQPHHLEQLVRARELDVHPPAVTRYRHLLDEQVARR